MKHLLVILVVWLLLAVFTPINVFLWLPVTVVLYFGVRAILRRLPAESSSPQPLDGTGSGSEKRPIVIPRLKPEIPFVPDPNVLLYWWEAEDGRGFRLRRSDGTNLPCECLTWGDGLRLLPVAGVTDYRVELQKGDFSVGRELTLVLEPENEYDPEAVAVWNKDRTVQVGYLPWDSRDKNCIHARLKRGEDLRAFSMWETLEGTKRMGLELLVTTEAARLGVEW